MNSGENNCIRYLMKEMDPSEELEFEQLMREDENLLIEVESLRATNKKLAQIKFKNPPESLTKKIANEAKQIQLDRLHKSNTYTNILRGIAAAILISALSGGYFFYNDFSNSEGLQPTAESESVTPWVDRNEILRYSNTSQTSAATTLDSEVMKSYEKLQLVTYPANGGNSSGIHLTRSSN